MTSGLAGAAGCVRACAAGFAGLPADVSFGGSPAAASFAALGAGITSGSTFGTWISSPAANVIPGFSCCSSAGVEWKRSASASSERAVAERRRAFAFSTMSSGMRREGTGGVLGGDRVRGQRLAGRRVPPGCLASERPSSAFFVFAPIRPSMAPGEKPARSSMTCARERLGRCRWCGWLVPAGRRGCLRLRERCGECDQTSDVHRYPVLHE